ncbi:MAG: ABC transporter permease [Trueperaceae bacterium]
MSAATSPTTEARGNIGVWRRVARAMRGSPGLPFGGGSILFFLLVALVGPAVVGDPAAQDVINRLQPPGAEAWFGTDEFGRDLFARMVYGTRTTLMVGALVTVMAGLMGLAVGVLAGYYRGLDNVLMRIMDGLLAFPSVVLALGLVAALGPRLSNTVVALAIVYTPRVARLARGVVLAVREQEYVMGARAVGARDPRIVFRYVLANISDVVIVQLSYIFALAVIAESALSFLGVTGSVGTPSWGGILSDGRVYVYQAPSMTVIPGLAIMLLVLALNLLGDALQERLDPRIRGRFRG